MAFDLATARPTGGGFDLSSAKPMEEHVTDPTKTLEYKMAMAGAKPAQTFPQYAGQSIKEMAIPAATTTIGQIVGNLPGAMAGSALGETINQSLGIGTPKSVFPELNKPDLFRIGVAGVAPAIVPAMIKAASTAKAAVEPFYQKGREQIIGRLLQRASGGQADEVARALATAKEIIPGSQPTVGQAAQNAGIASLERAAGAISPESTVAFQQREAAQNAARAKALENIAGNDDILEALTKHRETITAPLREQALSNASVPVNKITDRINEVMAKPGLRASEVVSKSLGEIKDKLSNLADESGIVHPQDLYMVRKEAGNVIKKYAEENKNFDQRLTAGLVKDVQGYIDNAIESSGGTRWRNYLTKYQELSKPIGQMKVGQAIADKAIDKTTGTLRPSAFTNALTDKTAQTATGFKQAALNEIMNPQQMTALNAIKDDLIRAVQARNMAGTAGSDTMKKLAYSNLIDRAGVPTFLREFAPTQAAGNLLARGADTLYGGANRDIAQQLAETMLNSQAAGRMMQTAGPSRYQAIIQALMNQSPIVAGTTVGQVMNQER